MGLIAAVAGVALGYAAAWPVVVKVFEARWSVDWTGVTTLIGAAAGLRRPWAACSRRWRALAQRPAPILRAE